MAVPRQLPPPEKANPPPAGYSGGALAGSGDAGLGSAQGSGPPPNSGGVDQPDSQGGPSSLNIGQGVIGQGGGGGSQTNPLSIPTVVVTPYDKGAYWAAKRLVGHGPFLDGRLPAIATLKGTLFPNAKRLPFAVVPDAWGNAWFMIAGGYDFTGEGVQQSTDPQDAWADTTAQVMDAQGWRDGNGTDAGLNGTSGTTVSYGGLLGLNWLNARAFDYDKGKISWPASPELVLQGPDYQTGVVFQGWGQTAFIYPRPGYPAGKGVEPRVATVSSMIFVLTAADGTKIGMLGQVNRWTRTGYFTQVLGAPLSSDDYTSWSTVLSTAGTGASIGTALLPGIGTLIGAAIGALADVIVAAIQLAEAQSDFQTRVEQAEALAFGKFPPVLSGFAPFSSLAQEYGLGNEGGTGAPGAPGSGGGGGVGGGGGPLSAPAPSNSLAWLALAGLGLYVVTR
jgi:hypothetical protein